MIDKFIEAAGLLGRHCLLLVAVVLTVWIPGNLLTNYLDFYVIDAEDVLASSRMYWFVNAILSPVPAAAVIAILSRSKLGRSASYMEVMGVAMKKWGPLFWARFIAGILVTLGFLALIIPGIVLSLRYALLDQAVVVEGADPGEARSRSAQLTTGVRWEILLVCLMFFIPFVALAFAVYLPFDYYPQLDQLPLNVFIDCCLDIAALPFEIVLFLYYWEATEQERTAMPIQPPANNVLTT